jgi:hypothetical protein
MNNVPLHLDPADREKLDCRLVTEVVIDGPS